MRRQGEQLAATRETVQDTGRVVKQVHAARDAREYVVVANLGEYSANKATRETTSRHRRRAC